MLGTSASQQEFLNRLSGLLEANLENEQFGVSELAREMGMSRSNLHRKVNSILNISASQYIREFRLEKAKELLQETALTVSEITWKVGFGSTSYFIKCFREHFGYTPGESENHKVTDEQPQKRKQWFRPVKLDKSDFIVWSLVFIVLLNIFFIVIWPRINSSSKNGKTIAIMHFTDLTPLADKSYIINGLREDILDNLSSVNDLKTVSEVLIDQYLDTDLSAIDVAKKTKADYLLTAKGETSNDNTTLWFTLTETNSGNQIWREKRSLSISNYFDVRKEIAFAVVNKLKANLTTEEKDDFEKIPTKNLAAYNMFLLGWEYNDLFALNGSYGDKEQHELLQKAKGYFEKAIQLDSTFSRAYVALGSIYIDVLSNTPDMFLSEQYMDSGLVMAKKALIYDNENSWAYLLIETYYIHKGDFTKAREYFGKVEKLNENDDEWWKYLGYFWHSSKLKNHYDALEKFYLYRLTKPEDVKIMPNTLYRYIFHLDETGFPEVSKKASEEILNIDNDSVYFFKRLLVAQLKSGNFKKGLEYVLKLEEITNYKSNEIIYWIFQYHYHLNQSDSAIYWYNEFLKNHDETTIPRNVFIEFGYIYLLEGQNEKARNYFSESINENQKEIEINRPNAQIFESHFRLACIFSALNQKEKAIEYLVQLKIETIIMFGWLPV